VEPGVADGAVDLPGREVDLAILVDGVDPEGGYGAVSACDADLVTARSAPRRRTRRGW